MSTQEQVERLKEGIGLIEQGVNKIKSVQTRWTFSCLLKAYELAMARAPFKVGDVVVLRRAPDCDKGSEHFLVAGAIGTVAEADIDDTGYCFYVTFGKESWISEVDKAEHFTPNQHQYAFRESWLTKL
jgi:hypothetical protein